MRVEFLKREDIPDLFKLDEECFGEGSTIDISMIEKWYDVNRYQWIVAKDEEDASLGYISFWHLNQDNFYKLVNGETAEVEMTEKNFLHFKEKNEIYMHICVFLVKDKNTQAAMRLINGAVSYFKFLKDNGIKVKKISTIPVTIKGLQLAKKLGFEKAGVGKALWDGIIPDIYVLDFEDGNISSFAYKIKNLK